MLPETKGKSLEARSYGVFLILISFDVMYCKDICEWQLPVLQLESAAPSGISPLLLLVFFLWFQEIQLLFHTWLHGEDVLQLLNG